MERVRIGTLALLLGFLPAVGAAPRASSGEPLVLPHPQEMKVGERQWPLVQGGMPVATITARCDTARGRFAAEWLRQQVKGLCGVELPLAGDVPGTGACILFHAPGEAEGAALAKRGRVDFGRSPDPQQAYAILPESARGRTTLHVVAPSDLGLVYAAYTIGQLLSGRQGECTLREARVFDYPAAPVRGMLWLRGNDAYRHAYCQWGAQWRLNAYTWYVDWNAPLSREYRDILRDCSTRGMTLVPTISWFQNSNIRYSSGEQSGQMLARVREALDAGAGAFGFNFDDNPLRVFGEDEKVYPSLIAAQADLLSKVHAVTGPAGAGLFFTPTIYWKPYPGAQGNSLEAQYEYVRGMGRLFPPEVKPFTTTLSKQWAEEYQREVRRKPVFWHNFFPNDMADWKLYFEPYPRFPEELVSRSDGAFVLGGWQTDWWKVNYLTFACNTWNPKRPCTLREAFERLYPGEAEALTRYAVLMGGHNEPASRIEMGPDHPHEQLRTGTFFNQDPTPANLQRLERRLDQATRAESLAGEIARRGKVPEVRARELVVQAARMRLNYRMALTACRVRKLEESGDRGRLASKETVAEVEAALSAGDEIEGLLKSVGWPTSQASDLALKSYFQSLKERITRGEGAVPRLVAVRCPAPLRVDGTLDEPAWEKAPSSTPFYVIEGSPRPATQQTEVRALFDDAALYLSFVCHEDQMGKLKTLCTRHDDMVWEDDCVEIFVDPKRSRKDYAHFVLSAAGVRFDERVTAGVKDSDWNGEWRAATTRAGDRWIAEVAIPFATLGISAPSATQRLGINVAREEVPHGEVSAWAITFGSFHQPSMFGDLAFGGEDEVVWVEAEKAEKTNFQYGVQLATARPEARGTSGTGYLNLNVAHPGGPSGDTPDGAPEWYAEWALECPRAGDYTLWVLGSDAPSGQPSWQLDDGPVHPERRVATAPAAPSYPRPLGLANWHQVALGDGPVRLAKGKHALRLRVRAKDPAASKRCGYFLDALVLAPFGWRP